MCLLLIDINHFIAFETFLNVPKTVGFMNVDFVSWKDFLTIVAWSLLTLVVHFFLYFKFTMFIINDQ